MEKIILQVGDKILMTGSHDKRIRETLEITRVTPKRAYVHIGNGDELTFEREVNDRGRAIRYGGYGAVNFDLLVNGEVLFKELKF